MAIVSGQIAEPDDIYKIMNTLCWNAFMIKKEIYAEGSFTPDAPYDYLYAETFRLSTGDNSTVASSTGGATYSGSPNFWWTATSNGTVVTSNIITTSSNIKGIFVSANKSLGSGTSITVDVSINNGSSKILTAQNLDTFLDTSGGTGTQLILTFNLNSGGNTVTLKDYSVMVFI